MHALATPVKRFQERCSQGMLDLSPGGTIQVGWDGTSVMSSLPVPPLLHNFTACRQLLVVEGQRGRDGASCLARLSRLESSGLGFVLASLQVLLLVWLCYPRFQLAGWDHLGLPIEAPLHASACQLLTQPTGPTSQPPASSATGVVQVRGGCARH